MKKYIYMFLMMLNVILTICMLKYFYPEITAAFVVLFIVVEFGATSIIIQTKLFNNSHAAALLGGPIAVFAVNYLMMADTKTMIYVMVWNMVIVAFIRFMIVAVKRT